MTKTKPESKQRTSSKTAAKQSTAVHHRFAARAKSVRRRPKLLAIWIGAVLSLGALIVLLAYLPIFTVQSVSVDGGDPEVGEQAVAAADIPSGLPLARIDRDEISDRVLSDPRVLSVDVDRSWPDSVVLRLDLRTPAVLIDQDGASGLQVAAADGVIYDMAGDGPDSLPTVAVMRGEVAPASVQEALYIAQFFADDELGASPEDLEITADGDLRFAVGEVEVDWGPAAEGELKASVLVALFAQPQIAPDAPTPLTVDVSAPANPVVEGLETVADE